MLYEVDWAEDGTYRPDEYNSPEKFFNDCLENSKEFDLQLGYFSSATISVLAEGFATFISNGGKMRLVINNIVSEEDKQAITKGVNGGIIDCFDLTNFNELRKTFDEYQQQFFDCLAFLIYHERIEIKIIKPRNKKGISHTKSGQFRDGDSITSFTGSANFTLSGLFNNLEEIKIDRSDSLDVMTRKRIESQRTVFDSIMNGKRTNIEYLSPENLVSAIKTNFGDKDIDDLLDVEEKLKQIRDRKRRMVVREDEDIFDSPHFPFPAGPRDYQKEALNKWNEHNQCGFFAMATGTGKTITSLNCLLDIFQKEGSYKSIILVPTLALLEQWEKECLKFGFTNIIKISSKTKWRENLSQITATCLFRPKKISYIILCSYASFVKDNVSHRLLDLPTSTLLIADEAHNMGSKGIRRILKNIRWTRRIGLSATPHRQYDWRGNDAICKFFDITENSYTFEYSMELAIKNEVLCTYRYFPHIVKLNDVEMEQYIEMSAKIAKYYNPDTDEFDDDPILTAMLLKRKRIIHKAANKLEIFKSVLHDIFSTKGSIKYTMVYVPEGVSNSSSLYDVDEESSATSDEDTYLINQYTKLVRDLDPSVMVEQFTSKETDREKRLKNFSEGKTDVLVAMKCLDEGVDVPQAENAIFCASTGNPRQFIQRRGRILRTHPSKAMAYIHDLVVIPMIDYDSDTFNMERSMLSKELIRVRDFASLSSNAYHTDDVLSDILDYYNLKQL